MNFAALLREHWPRYLAQVGETTVSADQHRAVEAVLACRTHTLGGHVYHCSACLRTRYQFHSCNHRNCPQCGASDRAHWAATQEARLLPVPYYLITVTVPEALRPHCLQHPRELYDLLLSQSARAVRDLCADPKFLGGQSGFIAVLQTWTRRMLHHPHVHLLVPAVALSPDGCRFFLPANEDFLLPVKALSARVRQAFAATLAERHPAIHQAVDPSIWREAWVSDCRPAGHGRFALRYLAAYIGKAAFNQARILDDPTTGGLCLRFKDSTDRRWKSEALDPLELIRRWLLHILPKGFVAVRHFGFLSPAAARAFARLRFLLGRRSVVKPIRPAFTAPCPCCQKPMRRVGRIPAARDPPTARCSRLAA